MTATAPDGAEAILDVLDAWGVERVFICPGSTEAAFLDAVERRAGPQLVLATHESVAVAAADAHARVTGRPAVAYLHTHLGLANGLAHLACAHAEHSPLVLLTGLKATAMQGSDGFTTCADVRALPRQFCKWEWQSLAAESVPGDLARALRTAGAAPAGPAWLGLPQDFLETTLRAPAPAAAPVAGRPAPSPGLLARAAQMLSEAARPVVVAGSEAARAGAWPALAELCERVGAVTLAEERRMIDTAAPVAALPNYAGPLEAGLPAAAEADLIVLAGTRNPLRFEPSTPAVLPGDTPVVHLCGDPAELALTGRPALSLAGDVAIAVAELARLAKPAPGRDDGFRERAVAAHRARADGSRARARADAAKLPIRVPSLMERLVGALEPGTLVVDDSVTSKAALLDQVLAPGGGLRYMTTTGGSLGWAMGAAVGAALASDAERVVAVVGDGVFQFGPQALWTAARERLPITWVVVNNRRYAAVGAALARLGRPVDGETASLGTDIGGPAIGDIASGFGVPGVRIERLDDLEPTLAWAGDQGGPALIEVLTDPGDLGPL